MIIKSNMMYKGRIHGIHNMIQKITYYKSLHKIIVENKIDGGYMHCHQITEVLLCKYNNKEVSRILWKMKTQCASPYSE